MGQLILRKEFSKLINRLFIGNLIRKNHGSIVAIDYHYFCDGSALKHQDLEISYEILNKQLEIISSNFCPCNAIITLNEIYDSKNLKTVKPKVIISVDDADISFKKAIKLFVKFDIPIILFAPVGLCLGNDSIDGMRSKCFLYYSELCSKVDFGNGMENKKSFFEKIMCASPQKLSLYLKKLKELPRDKSVTGSRTLLSIEDLKDIAKIPQISVASHSMSHSVLSELPMEWLSWEIKQSLAYIDQINGNTQLFCYPFGYKKSYNKDVHLILAQEGVKYSFSTVSTLINKRTNPLALGRTGMLNFADKNYVIGSIKGAFYIWDLLLRRT
tara:strand:+ start:846 stop:1829 length:984 start_codon:yes stop_codon:yes gene_type:complete